jgi:CrcB protein
VTLVLVMVGAAIGAPSRWLVDRAVQRRHDSVFPWGTFVVNIMGSLLLGFIMGATAFARIGEPWYAVLGTGFCGGFTTFSTFSYETFRLIEDGSRNVAARNVVVSLGFGLAAAYAGWYAASSMWG